MKSFALAVIVSLFPSTIQIALMRCCGAKIGSKCKFGFLAVLNCTKMDIGDNVQIAPFNLIHRLRFLRMGSGSRFNGFNWVTGARIGEFSVGRNTAITRFHFFEASASIYIGENTIIAGRSSHFFTHGQTSVNLEDMRPIRIGSWCYVGTSSRMVPGAEIAEGTFVGMASVITKKHCEKYALLGGSPARLIKRLSPSDIYFNRPFMPHDHHLSDYAGF